MEIHKKEIIIGIGSFVILYVIPCTIIKVTSILLNYAFPINNELFEMIWNILGIAAGFIALFLILKYHLILKFIEFINKLDI